MGTLGGLGEGSALEIGMRPRARGCARRGLGHSRPNTRVISASTWSPRGRHGMFDGCVGTPDSAGSRHCGATRSLTPLLEPEEDSLRRLREDGVDLRPSGRRHAATSPRTAETLASARGRACPKAATARSPGHETRKGTPGVLNTQTGLSSTDGGMQASTSVAGRRSASRARTLVLPGAIRSRERECEWVASTRRRIARHRWSVPRESPQLRPVGALPAGRPSRDDSREVTSSLQASR
jgi:hypothetical protein